MPAKDNRPRLDAIKRHILKGSYDDVLWEISGAIAERNKRRQDAVNKLVEQVYGEGFKVVPEGQVRRPQEVMPGESQHVQQISPARPDDPPPPEDEGLTQDYESRSPIIGPWIPPEDRQGQGGQDGQTDGD